MKTIWYIHGANETHTCFNYLRATLPDHDAVNINYDYHAPLDQTILQISKNLPKDEKITVLGHSMGGIIAVALSQISKSVDKVIALAAPFGGSESANYLRFIFPSYGLFKNVASGNPLIQMISKKGAVVPTLNLVATTGYNPLSAARNDGVITIDSQKKLPGARVVEVLHNHFEIVLADEVVELITKFVWEV